MLNRHKKKGNVLVTVLIVCFTLALGITASCLIVARYTAAINARYDVLQETVRDDISTENNGE